MEQIVGNLLWFALLSVAGLVAIGIIACVAMAFIMGGIGLYRIISETLKEAKT
jgi:hypothetical protein